MDTKGNAERIPTIEELQVEAMRWTARELELAEELKSVHDRRMIALGALGDRQRCVMDVQTKKLQDDIVAKVKAELEAQKPKE